MNKSLKLDTCSEVLKKNTTKYRLLGASKMAQRFRAPSALAEDPGSVPSTHMVASNFL